MQAIEGLELAGEPAMTVVAFKAANPRVLNIYAVNDALSARGWHLNALQLPPALHMCFTAQHASVVDALLKARTYLLLPSIVLGAIAFHCCSSSTSCLHFLILHI